MIKNISQTRRDYKRYYRILRQQGGTLEEDWPFETYNDIEDCAILSYDYHDSHFSGWINRQRMTAFEQRSRLIENWHGAIPF